MNYCLHITAQPYSSQGATSALLFARELVQRGHNVSRVFFSGEGVLNGNAIACPPQDELNITQAWNDFAKDNGSELILCIASALKYGVVDEENAQRYERSQSNLQEGFILSGLGQLVEASLLNDRLVRFS